MQNNYKLKKPIFISDDFVGYDDSYYLNNQGFKEPIIQLNNQKYPAYSKNYF